MQGNHGAVRAFFLTSILLLNAGGFSQEEATPDSESIDRRTQAEIVLTEMASLGAYAIYDGGEVTYAELAAAQSAPSNFQVIRPAVAGETSDDQAQELMLLRTLVDEAKTRGVEEGWVDLDAVERRMRGVIFNHLFQSHVMARVEVTEEAMHRLYEARLDDFREPLEFKMRTIFLSAYQEHVVASGETLLSVARDVSGSAQMARDIRTGDGPARRLVDPTLPVEMIESQARPLVEGETLLVPMPRSARAAVRERLEEIVADIDTEDEFIAAAKEHSESAEEIRGEEIGPLPGARPDMLPELLRAGENLPLRTVSNIIETKHGFQVVMITERNEQGVLPFEEVRARIENDVRMEEIRRVRRDWIQTTMERRGYIFGDVESVDLSNLANASAKVVLASAPGEEPITVADLAEALRAMPKAQQQTWSQWPLDLLHYLLLVERTDTLEDEWEVAGDLWMKPLVETGELQNLTIPYLNALVEAQVSEVSEEEIRQFYDENPDLFMDPDRISYHQIRKVIPREVRLLLSEQRRASEEAIVELLRSEVGEINSEEEFTARQEELWDPLEFPGADPAHVFSQTGVGTETLPEPFASAEAGTFVEPLIVGRWVVAAWVYEREPAHVRPYDLERLRAEEALKSQRREAYHDQLLQAAIERLNFRLVRPDPVADNAEEGPDNP